MLNNNEHDLCRFKIVERLGYVDYRLQYDKNVFELIKQNCEPIETDCVENKPYMSIYVFKILQKTETIIQHITDYGDRQIKIDYIFSPDTKTFSLKGLNNS